MMQVEEASLGQLAVCLRGLVYGNTGKKASGQWLPAFQHQEVKDGKEREKKVRSLPQVGGRPTHRRKGDGGSDVPGWVVGGSRVTLREDIDNFVEYMKLTEEEVWERADVVRSVGHCLSLAKPDAILSDPYCDVALPGSRIDLIVRNAGDFTHLPTLLLPHVETPQLSPDGTVTFTFRKHTVCLKQASSTEIAPIIKKYLSEIPHLRSTVILLQAILLQCNLINTVGGLDIWTLVVMAVSVYVRYTSVENTPARLFMDFLACFGWAFDYSRQGIDLNMLSSGSSWPEKQHRESFLCVCDPLDARINLSQHAYKAQQLGATFQYCYVSLSKWENGNPTHRYVSPLANIIAHKKLPARTLRPSRS